ncbi:MAG TPA: hypothetical protein VFW05_11940 [Verrucomicrobiae bacterium]|nr:hypothetical protein [Verrucomicrobiae bacterium]
MQSVVAAICGRRFCEPFASASQPAATDVTIDIYVSMHKKLRSGKFIGEKVLHDFNDMKFKAIAAPY